MKNALLSYDPAKKVGLNTKMSSDKSNAELEKTDSKRANCIFCSINHREIEASFIYEDDSAFAIRDINAQAPTHILVIPRKHVDNIASEEDKALIGSLFLCLCPCRRKGEFGRGFQAGGKYRSRWGADCQPFAYTRPGWAPSGLAARLDWHLGKNGALEPYRAA